MNSRRPIAVPWPLSLAAVLALLALAPAADVTAATITVGPGCSLASAIDSANANADTGGCTHEGAYGNDIIVLPNGTYAFTAAHSAGTALPAVTSAVTIVGNGSTIARTNGAAAPFFRLLRVTAGHLTLLDLTLQGGLEKASGGSGEAAGSGEGGGGGDGGGSGEGGAIRVSGGASLTLASVRLTNNAVDQSSVEDFGGLARGGAVFFASTGVLTLHDVTLDLNTADASGLSGGVAEGGAVYAAGPGLVFLTDVAASVNRAIANATKGGGGVARGGAVFMEVEEFFEDAVIPGAATRASEALPAPGSAIVTRGNFAGNTVIANGFGSHGGVAQGGGLYYESERPETTLVIAESIFLDNSATAIGNGSGNGGATGGAGAHVELQGAGLTVRDSTFTENQADGSANTGVFGGIFDGAGLNIESSDPGAITIVRSAFTGNVGHANGGTSNGGVGEGVGLRYQGSGSLTLVSVTAANNSGTCNAGGAGGGGVCEGGGVWFGGNLLTLTNTTITGNSLSATGSGACCAVDGGGFFIDSSATYQNSILAANVPDNCRADDLPDDVITSLGSNIIDNLSGCASLAAGDTLGAPALGPLTDTLRPGSVFRLPLPGGNAQDAGNPGACPAIDQRGLPRQGPCDIGAAELVDPVPQATLLAAVLPASRSGLAGVVLTAFVTIINTSATVTAHQVGIALDTAVPALLGFQTTDATNALVGTPDTPVDIAPGGAQSFVIFLRATGPFASTDLVLDFAGTNTAPVTAIVGLNTFLASASVTAIPDVVALAATAPRNDGIVDLVGGAGAFAVASINLGAGGLITISANTSTALGLALFVCQTDPVTSLCQGGGGPTPTVTTDIATNATPTFAIFVVAPGPVAFDPAVNRVFVFFTDANGVIRGGTSVAVRTL